MAAVGMGRFFFNTQTTAIWNFLNFGFAPKDVVSGMTHPAPKIPIQTHPNPSQKDLDLITDLPGLDYDPGFNQYSGYLTVDEESQRNIFYWYVESQGNPDDDPLLLWTNGGPGCSGLFGFGTEHGPFYFSADKKLSPNPFSWNKLANVLYIEIPAGVGFSYSQNEDDYTTGDAATAADNYMVIRKFLERFPERQSNEFYITSESYGGHYMPQLTLEILRNNNDGFINFKGMMIGNAYVEPYWTTITMFEAWYNHGLLPMPLYKQYADNCHDPDIYYSGQECLDIIDAMYDVIGRGVNYYALDYPKCLEKHESKSKNHLESQEISTTGDSQAMKYRTLFGSPQSTRLLHQTSRALRPETGNPPFLPAQDHFRICAENHFLKYIHQPEVVSAIHANASLPAWSGCSDRVFSSYSEEDSLSNEIPLYSEILEIIQTTTPLHILIYSGDDDSVCSLTCTQMWIWNLGVQPKHSCNWKPWVVQNQTAGYVTNSI